MYHVSRKIQRIINLIELPRFGINVFCFTPLLISFVFSVLTTVKSSCEFYQTHFCVFSFINTCPDVKKMCNFQASVHVFLIFLSFFVCIIEYPFMSVHIDLPHLVNDFLNIFILAYYLIYNRHSENIGC